MIPVTKSPDRPLEYRKLVIEEMEIDDSPFNLGNLLTYYDTGFKLVESLSPPTRFKKYQDFTNSMTIELSLDKTVHSRRVTSFLDRLASVGGLLGALSSISAFIVSFANANS